MLHSFNINTSIININTKLYNCLQWLAIAIRHLAYHKTMIWENGRIKYFFGSLNGILDLFSCSKLLSLFKIVSSKDIVFTDRMTVLFVYCLFRDNGLILSLRNLTISKWIYPILSWPAVTILKKGRSHSANCCMNATARQGSGV